MGRRQPNTPRSRIRNVLRRLWMWSRERRAAIKASNNTCADCGRKGGKAKGQEVRIEVHHKDGHIAWEAIINAIFEHLLCGVDRLVCLCDECHAKRHEGKEKG